MIGGGQFPLKRIKKSTNMNQMLQEDYEQELERNESFTVWHTIFGKDVRIK